MDILMENDWTLHKLTLEGATEESDYIEMLLNRYLGNHAYIAESCYGFDIFRFWCSDNELGFINRCLENASIEIVSIE